MKVVYTFCSIVFLGIVFAVSAGLLDTKKAESGLTITAPDGFAVACGVEYVRLLPHYCRSLTFFNTALTIDGLCNSLDVHVASGNRIPQTAQVGEFALEVRIIANNAISQRSVDITFYSDPSCNIAFQASPNLTWTAREPVAVAANPTLVRFASYNNTWVMTDAILYYIATSTNCGVCTAQIWPVGYYD